MNDSDLFLRAFRFKLTLRRSPDETSGLQHTGITTVAEESAGGALEDALKRAITRA